VQSGVYGPSVPSNVYIKTALINAGATPEQATTLTAISGAESGFGKSPVSKPNTNGSRDYGVFQVNDHAWPQFGGARVAGLPLDQQAAIAVHIWNTQGPQAWTTYKDGAYKKFLSGADAATAPASAPATTNAVVTGAGIGSAIAALNAPTGGTGTKSTMDNLESMAGGEGGGGSSPAPLDLQTQQIAAASGNARQQQLAMQGAQLAAALRGQGGLKGAPGPSSTQTMMGGQIIPMANPAPTPGTTLNSTGLYG
jgi:hypothetical protein